MALTAQVIQMDERRSSGPQLEDGHIRIANELFDAILRFRFTLKQQSVVLAIMRKTYGYGKKADDMSASQIGEACGMSRNHVTETLNELAAMNVITKSAGNYGCVIGINKLYKEWKEVEKSKKNTPASPESGLVPNQDTSPESGLEVVPNRDRSIVPNRDTQKTTFQKTTSKEKARKPAAQDLPHAPDWMPEVAWQDFVEHRKQIKHPLTALAAKRFFEKVAQLRQAGHSPAKLIDTAIRNGWRDVFPRDETKAESTMPGCGVEVDAVLNNPIFAGMG